MCIETAPRLGMRSDTDSDTGTQHEEALRPGAMQTRAMDGSGGGQPGGAVLPFFMRSGLGAHVFDESIGDAVGTDVAIAAEFHPSLGEGREHGVAGKLGIDFGQQ